MSSVKETILIILLFQIPLLRKVCAEVGLNPNYNRNLLRPSTSRLLDQYLGLVADTDDFFRPLFAPRWLSGSALENWRSWGLEPLREDSSSVIFDKEKFQASLNVQQFKPEEISVKLTGDDTITVEGKHEEKQDEHGYISRHFVRKYVLPKVCNPNKIESKLSSDGVLTISAPRTDAEEANHKEIPIQQTGEPAKRIEKKEDSKQEQRNEL